MNAVITGASKGIGKAIALKFASQGFSLAICSRNPEHLKETAQELKGAVAVSEACDVSSRSDVNAFCKAVSSRWKNIDVLVNNAGYYVPGHIHNEAEGVLEKMISTNLYGAYHITRGLIGLMMPHRTGHIFNMCSVASTKAYTNGGAYSISKHAIYGFSKVLREEMKPFGIRVTSILPGSTGTDSWAGSSHKASRFMTPADIADMVWAAWFIKSQSVVEEIVMRPLLGDIDEKLT